MYAYGTVIHARLTPFLTMNANQILCCDCDYLFGETFFFRISAYQICIGIVSELPVRQPLSLDPLIYLQKFASAYPHSTKAVTLGLLSNQPKYK